MRIKNNDRGQLIHKAIRFAEKAHRGQKRKGSDIAYLTHLMEVAQILSEIAIDENVIVAGILHDTIEDTKVTEQDIQREFGDEIAELVASHTEDKTQSWEDRKKENVRLAAQASLPTRLIIFADALANLRSMLYDYRELGDELWQRFRRGKKDQAEYYEALYYVLEDLKLKVDASVRLVEEFKSLTDELFTKLYYDEKNQVFYIDQNDGEISFQHILSPKPTLHEGGRIPAYAREISIDDWRTLRTQAFSQLKQEVDATPEPDDPRQPRRLTSIPSPQ